MAHSLALQADAFHMVRLVVCSRQGVADVGAVERHYFSGDRSVGSDGRQKPDE